MSDSVLEKGDPSVKPGGEPNCFLGSVDSDVVVWELTVVVVGVFSVVAIVVVGGSVLWTVSVVDVVGIVERLVGLEGLAMRVVGAEDLYVS